MPDPTPGERTRIMLRQALVNHAHSWDEAHLLACGLAVGMRQYLGALGMDTSGLPAHWVGFVREILHTYDWHPCTWGMWDTSETDAEIDARLTAASNDLAELFDEAIQAYDLQHWTSTEIALALLGDVIASAPAGLDREVVLTCTLTMLEYEPPA